jgi:prepilin-type N-terminal cleavage/methylation domain-containing protein
MGLHRIRDDSPRGFTLLELLAVVSMGGILVAILIPVLGDIRMSAQMAQSGSNLRQLAIANHTHALDHGHFAPADDRWNDQRWHGARASASAPFDPTRGYLADYLGTSRRVMACPLFERMTTSERAFEVGTGGYGYNSAYIGGLPAQEWNSDGSRKAARPEQIHQVKTVMFTTTAYAIGDSLQEYAYSEPPFWDFGAGPSGLRPSPSVHFRFRDRALVAWYDGHVSAEARLPRQVGTNPHGGDAEAHGLGWFGPDAENGYWNPARTGP